MNRDFEQYLKENADQYRMFPSEKVWDNIHARLHTRRRWYGIGLALVLFGTAAVTAIVFLPAGRRQQIAESRQIPSQPNTVNTTPAAVEQPGATLRHRGGVWNLQSPAASGEKTRTLQPALPRADKHAPDRKTENTDAYMESKPSARASLPPIEKTGNPSKKGKWEQTVNALPPSSPSLTTVEAYAQNQAQKMLTAEQAVADLSGDRETDAPEPEKEIVENKTRPVQQLALPSIESVIMAYQHRKIRKRVSWHLFATPTITYRKLNENKAFLDRARTAFNLPTNYSFADINSMVTHKPDVGIQLGVGGSYPITRRLSLITGLQFNVSKYDIRAYNHGSEVTTIALSTDYGGANTISTISNYRNIGGYKSDWLHNLYFSASAPLGLELNLSGPGKADFGISSTIQPTYILGNRAYLLSADLKNYAEMPSLTRKWNLNTGIELFAGYNTRKMSWRIGPQVRYQVFSSFIKHYPISEHLFDFGIKLGVIVK